MRRVVWAPLTLPRAADIQAELLTADRPGGQPADSTIQAIRRSTVSPIPAGAKVRVADQFSPGAGSAA